MTQSINRALAELGGEKPRTDGVDCDVVLAPFGAQGPREVDGRTLGGVVGNGVHRRRVATQPGDGGDVDDAPTAPRNHALFGNGLAEQKVAPDVEVHHLVPGRNGVVFGGSAPSRTGVVDQNIKLAHALQGFTGQASDLVITRAVGGDPPGVNTSGLQLGAGLLELWRFARAEHDARPGLAKRVSHLQTQATRAAGNQRRLAAEVKQLLDGACHGSSPVEGRDCAGASASAVSRLCLGAIWRLPQAAVWVQGLGAGKRVAPAGNSLDICKASGASGSSQGGTLGLIRIFSSVCM